jgi:hypothetical protein
MPWIGSNKESPPHVGIEKASSYPKNVGLKKDDNQEILERSKIYTPTYKVH